MNASIYRRVEGTYLAILGNGQHIVRGGLDDLAVALRVHDIPIENILFGDWLADAILLSRSEQIRLIELMATSEGVGF
jgi:hypothetical protein